VVGFAALARRKRWPRITRFDTFRSALIPVTDRLSSILPKGGADAAVHRGARRRFRRWALDAEVELLAPSRGSGLAINASVGGLRIAVDMGVPVDHVCTLRVRTAPNHETIEHAKVVWSRAQPDGYVLGLEFIAAPSA
jgi:hypothetical protein